MPSFHLPPLALLHAYRAWAQSDCVQHPEPLPKSVWLEAWAACHDSLALDEVKRCLLSLPAADLTVPAARVATARELHRLLVPLGFSPAEVEQFLQLTAPPSAQPIVAKPS